MHLYLVSQVEAVAVAKHGSLAALAEEKQRRVAAKIDGRARKRAEDEQRGAAEAARAAAVAAATAALEAAAAGAAGAAGDERQAEELTDGATGKRQRRLAPHLAPADVEDRHPPADPPARPARTGNRHGPGGSARSAMATAAQRTSPAPSGMRGASPRRYINSGREQQATHPVILRQDELAPEPAAGPPRKRPRGEGGAPPPPPPPAPRAKPPARRPPPTLDKPIRLGGQQAGSKPGGPEPQPTATQPAKQQRGGERRRQQHGKAASPPARVATAATRGSSEEACSSDSSFVLEAKPGPPARREPGVRRMRQAGAKQQDARQAAEDEGPAQEQEEPPKAQRKRPRPAASEEQAQQPQQPRRGGRQPQADQADRQPAAQPQAAAAAAERGAPRDVAAVVAAAGLPRLAAGRGLLKKDVARGRREEQVALDSYARGDATGAHCKLYAQVPTSGGGSEWKQVSKSCHDCQVQHVPWTCAREGCRGQSVCNRCLVYRYDGLYSLAELHEACPACRGVCTCRRCLRTADAARLLPPPSHGPGAAARFGAHALRLLRPLLADLLAAQEEQAAAWGVGGGLAAVPREALAQRQRVLCDRCGTHVVGLLAHCAACEWDVCASCIADLRRGAASGGRAARGPLSCSNPGCRSAPRAARRGPDDELVRGGLGAIPGAQELELQLLLPKDLLGAVERLQALAADAGGAAAPSLDDCPLLQSGVALPPRADGRGPITLQALQQPDWWRVLPAQLRDAWRRKAAPGAWLFTPHADDLAGACCGHGPGGANAGAAAGAGADGERCALARALFWARWALGEPVLVRGAKGRIPWDPATLRRAVRDIKAERAGARGRGGGGGAAAAEDAAEDEDDAGDSDDEGGGRLTVLDCADFRRINLPQHDFFKGFTHGHFVTRRGHDGEPVQEVAMLKVKDWPPRSQFRAEMQRHFVDFLEALPLRCAYTDPRLGAGLSPLNLATALTPDDNPTDLGPKCYVAYGRTSTVPDGGEGDSVTKLHCDMADAVNLLLHATPGGDPGSRAAAAAAAASGAAPRCGDAEADAPGCVAPARGPRAAQLARTAAAAAAAAARASPAHLTHGRPAAAGRRYGGAGAVWDICPRGAPAAALDAWLRPRGGEFVHQGEPVAGSVAMAGVSPTLSQAFMLGASHLAALAADAGVALWRFEQHEGEAVFVPGGCPHQVRNLASCCKVAVDFVSPESMAAALDNREALRAADLALPQPLGLPPTQRQCQEKLQSQLLLLRGVLRAADAVAASGGEAAEGEAGGARARRGGGAARGLGQASASGRGRGGRGRARGRGAAERARKLAAAETPSASEAVTEDDASSDG
ncbi:JMJ25 [Scenedesmus sp. PABB004]|nr:JMJ25 [Scenedesmus sp. PABB004]